jgi:hypothetical protein
VVILDLSNLYHDFFIVDICAMISSYKEASASFVQITIHNL